MTADEHGLEATVDNEKAPFTLRLPRGEGMALVSIDWCEEPWWKPYYTEPAKIRDREVFA